METRNLIINMDLTNEIGNLMKRICRRETKFIV